MSKFGSIENLQTNNLLKISHKRRFNANGRSQSFAKSCFTLMCSDWMIENISSGNLGKTNLATKTN